MSYGTAAHGRLISRSKLIDKELIGQGSFGQVFKATWLAKDDDEEVEEIVAIKIMKNGTRAQVMHERDRMAGLHHENVVGLRGIVQLGGGACPWLVMEYVENGDLLRNILEWKANGGTNVETMMTIAWNIAKGMKYLHANDIIHGDLAARNILLGENGVAKIGDLGYYDSQNASDYYNYGCGDMPCPIRWMSPENLPYRLCGNGLVAENPKRNCEGDIWAFGVVLFELWSRGESPFDGHSNIKVCSLLLNGKKPTHFFNFGMRQHMKGLMHNCWQFSPSNRPTFYTIVKHFEEFAGFEPEDDSDSDDDETVSDSPVYYSSSSSDDYYY